MTRLLCVIACISLCIGVFSGCDFVLGETDTLLRAPQPIGELGEIREALESAVGKKFTLKSPKSGDWRTAFIVKDTDGDETEDALAFYSLSVDGATELHMCIIHGDGKDWKVRGDLQLGGTDVERVEFADLNGDKTQEVTVAWSIYGAPEKRLTVFSLHTDTPLPLYEGSYTDFCTYDMNESGGEELLVFATEPDTKTTRCSLFYGEESKLIEGGNTLLSGNISAVKKFHKTKLEGSPALYIDAATADGGYCTEIVTLKGGRPIVPMKLGGAKSNVITGRYQPINCGDVDGDGDLEIPCMTVLPNGGNSDATLYLTEWKEYSEGRLQTVEKSVVSKLMQYKIKVESDWQGKFSCVYTGENDGMELYSYNSKRGLGQKVMGLIALNRDGFDSSEYKDMFKIAENDKTVYLCKIYIKNNALGITRSSAKKLFSQNITEETEE